VVIICSYVLSANNERRHLSMPERAAATALTLATDGKRDGGRWEYGSVIKGTAPESGGSAKSGWSARMKDAGLVYDYLGAERLKRVACATLADYAQTMTVAIPVIPYLALSALLGVNCKR